MQYSLFIQLITNNLYNLLHFDMEKRLTTSEKVRIELIRKNMTQAELSEKLGVDQMTISRRLSSNAWKPIEVFFMKNSLKFDL